MSGQDYEQLTLFREGSRVSRSLRPGSDEARMMTATSGLRCCELSRSCGPLGYLERMLLASKSWHSTQCFLTWKAKATRRGRLWFQLAPSERRTEDTDSQYWPTPTATDAAGFDRNLRKDATMNRSISLAQKVAALQPGDGRLNPEFVEWLMGYEIRFTKLMPTLTASDSAGAPADRFAGGGNYRRNLSELVEATPWGIFGKLNPEWAEWFMGFPIGWTESNVSETRSSRSSSTPSSNSSMR